MSRILLARRYDTDEVAEIVVAEGLISAIRPVARDQNDPSLPWIAPSLFDLQVNGFGGVWFSDDQLTEDGVRRVVDTFWQHGVTQICPTLVTNSLSISRHAAQTIARACDRSTQVNRSIAGLHLEGPHISREDGARGAHPLAHVRPPSVSEFESMQEASGGRIKLVTLAPESPGAIPYIQHLAAQGITVSIGHTNASADVIREAVQAGATLSTHLGNGCATMIHRHRNVLWPQLIDERLWASIIADGIHLPEDLLKLIVRLKGPQQIVITCDSSGWGGMPPGVYSNEFGVAEILSTGKLVVAGQTEILAGSASTTDECIGHAVKSGGLSLPQAIQAGSHNPRRLLRLPVCELKPNSVANLMLFRWDASAGRLTVQESLLEGETVFKRNNRA